MPCGPGWRSFERPDVAGQLRREMDLQRGAIGAGGIERGVERATGVDDQQIARFERVQIVGKAVVGDERAARHARPSAARRRAPAHAPPVAHRLQLRRQREIQQVCALGHSSRLVLLVWRVFG